MTKKFIDFLRTYSISPETINPFLANAGTSALKQKMKVIEVAKRPQVKLKALVEIIPGLEKIYRDCGKRGEEVLESAEITIKYEGYISRERQMADKIKRLEKIMLDEGFDYHKLKSISTEARQKLSRPRPRNRCHQSSG